MFPLKADDPYINKDGSRTTLGDITGDISGIIGDIDGLETSLGSVTNSITPIIQTGTEATEAIGINEYFFLDGYLVKAKTAIAIGDTFTLGTNYTLITSGGYNDLFDAIAALQTDLGALSTIVGNLKHYTYLGSTTSDTGVSINGTTYKEVVCFAYLEGSASTVIPFNLITNYEEARTYRLGYYASASDNATAAIHHDTSGSWWGWAATKNGISVLANTTFFWWGR